MRLVVTGGAGYIGSHTCVALLAAGHDLTVIDDFSNSDRSIFATVNELTGKNFDWVDADIRDRMIIENVLSSGAYDAIMHLAALKSAAESIEQPTRYWDVNVGGTAVLLEIALQMGIDKFIFCSSAAIYGAQTSKRVVESCPASPATPYARTKFAAEQIVRDVARARPAFRACILRCFNPIGVHPSGKLKLVEPLTHDAALFVKVLTALRDETVVDVYGMDFETPDRSAVRDFLHVMDIAEGFVSAMEFLARADVVSHDDAWTFNLGSGRGCSVLELIAMMEKVGKKPIHRRTSARRSGDIVFSVADPTRSATMLGWRAQRSVEQACADALRSF